MGTSRRTAQEVAAAPDGSVAGVVVSGVVVSGVVVSGVSSGVVRCA